VSILIDTNVLLRRTQPDHEHHIAAVESVAGLLAEDEPVYFTLQNIAEFWCVATRPIANNGLDFSPTATLAEVNKIERVLTMLPDSPLAYEEWKRLVLQHGITGVRVHDARLVALMNVHRVRRILTFDGDDFTAYGVEVIQPALTAQGGRGNDR
jgi:predicted nucleic acid-binding protein